MAIEHHITLEERTDTLAYASATTPPAPTMPNVKASAKKTKTFSVISLDAEAWTLASRVDLIFSENGMQSSLLSSFGLTRLMKQPAKHISGISDHIFIKAIFGK